MFAMKVHHCRGEVLVAACDLELLDQEFREGKKRLKVSSSFYMGEEGSQEMLCNRMGNASIINLVGERSIEAAGKIGLHCEKVICIDGVPHAQIVRL